MCVRMVDSAYRDPEPLSSMMICWIVNSGQPGRSVAISDRPSNSGARCPRSVPLLAPSDPLRGSSQSCDSLTVYDTVLWSTLGSSSGEKARRSERDLILKMPTGTGKSTVGLLYLMSHMVESRQPGVYLCPNKQLVGQVLEEAARLGVRAHAYPTGQPHPHVDCMNAEAVIVCTYDKLFNAKSTFQRDDVNI